MEKRTAIGLVAIGVIIVLVAITAFVGHSSLSNDNRGWRVTRDGLLDYSIEDPNYKLTQIETDDNSTLEGVTFTSRDAQIAGLLRIPKLNQTKETRNNTVPGIVLLPGATITKEREQPFAKYLNDLGFASLTLDQRNTGAIDLQGDLQLFSKGIEPTEHKMVYDSLEAAKILRAQQKIDPNRTLYLGESNGGRVAIIACALDPKARGVVAISTSGYGADEAIASGLLKDPVSIQFLRSVDPETYLSKIPPRKLAMFHSLYDPVIPYEQANETYAKAFQPKDFYAVGCAIHGHCTEMDVPFEKDLVNIVK